MAWPHRYNYQCYQCYSYATRSSRGRLVSQCALITRCGSVELTPKVFLGFDPMRRTILACSLDVSTAWYGTWVASAFTRVCAHSPCHSRLLPRFSTAQPLARVQTSPRGDFSLGSARYPQRECRRPLKIVSRDLPGAGEERCIHKLQPTRLSECSATLGSAMRPSHT